MFWGSNKRKQSKHTRMDSLIGQNTRIIGNISFSGGLHIDGIVKGDVVADDDDSSVLTLSDRGTVEGDLRVSYVILNGVVIGDVHAPQHIELAPNARVEGNVYYNLIEMAMGAEVNGQLVRLADKDTQEAVDVTGPLLTDEISHDTET
jgi:cytoskeletal protein CcmA (bactofilin family)